MPSLQCLAVLLCHEREQILKTVSFPDNGHILGGRPVLFLDP